MNFKKTLLALIITASGFTAVNASANGGSGQITFNGSIIDSPCSIHAGDDSQIVELGQVSSALLTAGKESAPQSFTLRLENCAITTKDTVTATFTGTASAADSESLGLTGSAGGAHILMETDNGTKVKLNVPTAEQTLIDGNNTLGFSARLKPDSASATITPGSFTSVTNFVLNYQ
jgi:type 1 fimbria pilin